MSKLEEMQTSVENLKKQVDDALLFADDVKAAIQSNGIEVADGTPVSEYSGKIEGLYEAGKKAEYDEFWAEARAYDIPNPFGWQGLYKFAGRSWTNKNFKPPYDIVPRNANYMFCANGIKGDFQQILDDLGITIDFSNVITMNNCFAYSGFTKIPLLSTSLCTNYGAAFANADKLVDISFTEGCIGADIDFKHCPLNKASLISVINGLSSTAEKKTVTLRLSAVNAAFETAEGLNDGSTSQEWLDLAATKSNWTISLINS